MDSSGPPLFCLDKIRKIPNKNRVMRRTICIIVLALCCCGLATAAAAAPKVGSVDGSLVLEGGKDSRKAGASGDTLYDLLGNEVQVYIYNSKTRVWPKTVVIHGMNVRSGSWGYRGGTLVGAPRSPGGCPDQ